MIPTINVDVRRKKAMESRMDDDLPGGFSPRPSHSHSCSLTNAAQEMGRHAIAALGPVEARECRVEGRSEKQSSLGAAEALSLNMKREGSPAYILSRPTPSFSMSSESGEEECSERSIRYSSPRATLLEHQRVRSRFAPLQHVYATAISDRGNGCKRAASDPVGIADAVAGNDKLSLLEAYVSGKPCQNAADFHRMYSRNPSLNVSALATSSSGEYVAIGDRSGCVFVMRRVNHQEEKKKNANGAENAVSEREEEEEMRKNISRIRNPYEYAAGRQAYTSVIDPLNSVEVTPCIQALCFLPQSSPTTYLLTANEKMPKLYKVVQVQESTLPFSAVNHLGEPSSVSLTLNPLGSTTATAMKQVSRYALNHEYNINSICMLSDREQFCSADDLSVKLWCIEHPDTSIETYSLKSPFEEEVQETIFGIRCFPHEPFLLFIVTTAGTVRVLDIRQKLKLFHQAPLVFKNTYYNGDTVFTNALTDCALSPCGRFVAGRDAMNVCLWDIRHPSASGQTLHTASSQTREDEYEVIKRWELYPHLRQSMDELFQGDVIEQFNVRFLNRHELCTGGFARTLYVLDTMKDTGSPDDSKTPLPRCSNGQAFLLPQSMNGASSGSDGDGGGETQLELGSLRPIPMDEVKCTPADDVELFFSNTVTQFSQPLTSVNRDCSLLVSSGQTVYQLGYTNFR